MKNRKEQAAANRRYQAEFRKRQRDQGYITMTVMVKEIYAARIKEIIKELNEL